MTKHSIMKQTLNILLLIITYIVNFPCDANEINTSTVTNTSLNPSSTSDLLNNNNKTILKQYELYHSIATSNDSNQFSRRGYIEITAPSIQKEIQGQAKDSQQKLIATFYLNDGNDDNNLPTSIYQDMKFLIETGGYYTVKAVDTESGNIVISSVSACDVLRSDFREEIDLTLSNSGSLLSMSYKPLIFPLAASCNSILEEKLANLDSNINKPVTNPAFKTKVQYSLATQGMSIPIVLPNTRPPPGLKWLKRSTTTNTGNSGGEQQGGSNSNIGNADGNNPPFFGEDDPQNARPNQSFLRRYWYIILPMVIMTFLGADDQQPEQQSSANTNKRKESSSGGGSAVSASSSQQQATPSGGGSQLKQRRGKRG